MAGLSDALEKELLDRIFKSTAMSNISNLYVSLHTADPGDTGANELPVQDGYARERLDPDANNSTTTNWSAVSSAGAGSREVTNTTDIVFSPATANWNSGNAIGYFGLFWDNGGTDVFVGGGQINGSTGVFIMSGNILSFPANNLHFSVA